MGISTKRIKKKPKSVNRKSYKVERNKSKKTKRTPKRTPKRKTKRTPKRTPKRKTKKRYKNQKGKGYTFGFTNPLGKEPSLVKYGMEYSPVYPGSKISGTSNNSCEVKFVKNMNGCNN